MVELYNPGWQDAQGVDRTQMASKFYSSVPCVVVNPSDVWDAEIKNHLDPLDDLPTLLDLREIDDAWREEAVLSFLRTDSLYLQQGKNIREWADTYRQLKERWLYDVDEIIDHACSIGNLARDSQGRLIHLADKKELFLFSLDLRRAPSQEVDAIIGHQVKRRLQRGSMSLSSVRLSSLVFWYLYVDIDPSNKVRTQGSDIGDLYHLSLLPYCNAFTVDKSMHQLLMRIKEPFKPIQCKVLTKPGLKKAIGLEA